MKRLLAADIGGSKTRIQILDTEGKVLSEACGVGVASISDDPSSLPTLEALLFALADKEKIAAIAINLGGKNTEQVLRSFGRAFPNVPTRIGREAEGSAAYALGEKYGAPIVLMAGTGAIAVGRCGGKFVTTGGWGCHIGDDGSGYDVGLQAIRASLLALDGTEPLTPLSQRICSCEEPFSPTDTPSAYRDMRDRVREGLFPLDRSHIASLAKVVCDFAEQGDKLALAIFENAGNSLSRLVAKTAKKLGIQAPAVVVTGGLIGAKKFWAPTFEKQLSGVEIHYVEDGLLCGTRRIVKELYESGDKTP